MADTAEKGIDTWVKWAMGIIAVILSAGIMAMASWLFNTTSTNNTSITALAVSTKNVETLVTEIKTGQAKSLELLQGAATKREVGDLRLDLQAEIDELKDRLATVEKELALIEDRGKR